MFVCNWCGQISVIKLLWSVDFTHVNLCWVILPRSDFFSNFMVSNLRRLRTSDVDRFNERKWLYTGKGRKQTVPRTNDYGRGLS